MKRITVLLSLLLVLPIFSHAASGIFLDGSTSGCTNGSTNYNPSSRSCGDGSDIVYTDLNSFTTNIVAGATNQIRTGNYYRTTGNNRGALDIEQAGTAVNPTIIQAYPGEERKAVIATAADKFQYNPVPSDTSSSGNGTYYYPNPAITVRANHVTIDGMKTFGQLIIKDTIRGSMVYNTIIKNCDLGGGGPYYNWGHVVYMGGTRNALITNNLIHDSSDSPEQNSHKALYNIYESRDFVVEKNTFYNAHTGPMTAMGDAHFTAGGTATWRYNLYRGDTGNPTNGWQGPGQYADIGTIFVHNNIFLQTGISWRWNGQDITEVHNNTFINADIAIDSYLNSQPNTWGRKVHNNIFYNTTTGSKFIRFPTETCSLINSDYNIFYSSGVSPSFSCDGVSKSFSQWSSATNGENLSIVGSDPNFFNPTGTDAVDFMRHSPAENFTGSPYGSKAGAYASIYESEVSIGFQIVGATPPVDNRPSPPKNFIISLASN